MNYWLTVHWPAREDEDQDANWQYWIFLAQGWESSGNNIKPGDRVVIYETANAPRVKLGRRLINRLPGRKGVIAIATIKTVLVEDPKAEIEELEDGRKRRWSFRAKTKIDSKGFMTLNDLRKCLDKNGFSARIPGGLMKLKATQFNSILNKFSP